ncbi:MAG: hypothetical protein IJO31_03100 [Oscillospiraceae bacterium]|nr:hypothetical protein [Oscillospiraceae bacterium]
MDLMQLYRVAKMYYLDGMNQAEIGRQENLSRSQISRLLEQSRQQGLVRIEVMLPDQLGSDKLESLLARELNLQNLVIVPVDEMDLSEEVINLAIAMGAAPLIANTIRNSRVVGVGWGRTVYQASFHVPFGNYDSETLFVPLVGTSGTNDPHLQINAIIDRFAQKYRGKSFFSGMQVFREREMPLSRLETKRLHNMQHYWNLLDAAIFGLGGRLSDDTFFAEELGEEYAQYIKRSNIVGDVLAQFFFEDGTSMDLQERYRQTAFAIEKLPKVPKTICLAGGKDKVDALYAGARAGFFKTLVTDSVTARLLYEKIRRQIEQ